MLHHKGLPHDWTLKTQGFINRNLIFQCDCQCLLFFLMSLVSELVLITLDVNQSKAYSNDQLLFFFFFFSNIYMKTDHSIQICSVISQNMHIFQFKTTDRNCLTILLKFIIFLSDSTIVSLGSSSSSVFFPFFSFFFLCPVCVHVCVCDFWTKVHKQECTILFILILHFWGNTFNQLMIRKAAPCGLCTLRVLNGAITQCAVQNNYSQSKAMEKQVCWIKQFNSVPVSILLNRSTFCHKLKPEYGISLKTNLGYSVYALDASLIFILSTCTGSNSEDRFTTSFLQALPYLVTP